MKRTLTISLLLAGTALWAQNPVVLENTAKAAKPAQASASVKPSPNNVKVVPVPVHKPAMAKPAVVAVSPVKAHAVAVTAVPKPVAQKPVAVKSVAPHAVAVAVKPAGNKIPAKTVAVAKVQPAVKVPTAKAKDPFGGKKAQTHPVKASPKATVAVSDGKPGDKPKEEPKKISQNGRRDPFVSPVINIGAVGSGCSSGKRCLAIDQIALKGVVKSDTGMIAVVVNAMDKAYFLRENDPVFNGYVLKITGDSVVFKESYRDRLGKPLTRDITKTISRPAV